MNEETELLKEVERIVRVPHAVYFDQLAKSVQIWAGQVDRSWFWQKALESLPSWKEEYSRMKDDAKLLPDDRSLPEFKPKRGDRIKEKFFREAMDEGGNFKFEKIWPVELDGAPSGGADGP